jgi:hypothetical protein
MMLCWAGPRKATLNGLSVAFCMVMTTLSNIGRSQVILPLTTAW